MSIVAPQPKFAATYVDSNGFTVPAVGWKLYTYTAATSTPKDTYTDITLGSSNTNPVVLDARGEASVWLNGSYKLVLKTDTDSTIWTVDEVRDLTSDGIFVNATLNGTLTISSTSVTWSGNPTHSGNHTFTNNVTVKGNTQLGDQSTDTLRIDPNTVTWTNNPTHSGNHTWSGNLSVGGTIGVTGTATFVNATASGNSFVSGATSKLGYTTGSGGTVTQATSKTTSVTINKSAGQITMNGAALGAGASASFFVNNSQCSVSCIPIVVLGQPSAMAELYDIQVTNVDATSFTITVKNISAGSRSDTLVLNFCIINGATA
jgi:hypothetical protein